MKIIADLHSHTNVSHHAFSSINEMISRARDCGLKALAVTDHGPAMEDAPHRWYFANLLHLPNVLEDGFILLKGVEANIVGTDGKLDCEQKLLKKMDWVVASLHQSCIVPHNATQTWLQLAQNPYVDMAGHPEQQKYMFDYNLVTKAFAKNNKVVEINQGSALSRPGNEENLMQLALACKKNKTQIAVTSDAHSTFALGCYGGVFEMLKRIDFPKAQIINASMGQLAKALKAHGRDVYKNFDVGGNNANR